MLAFVAEQTPLLTDTNVEGVWRPGLKDCAVGGVGSGGHQSSP